MHPDVFAKVGIFSFSGISLEEYSPENQSFLYF